MPVLFEGFRDNVDVMLPILEEFGFKGWFFVPSAFPAVVPDVQRSYAKAHKLHLPARDEYPGRAGGDDLGRGAGPREPRATASPAIRAATST